MNHQPKLPAAIPSQRKASARWAVLPLAAALLTSGALLPAGIPAAQAASPVYVGEATPQAQSPIVPKTLTMKINGKLQSVPGAVSRDGSTTYVAVRFLSDKLGLKVAWNQQNQASTVSGRNVTIVTKAGEPLPYTINGQRMYGTAPVVQNGTTYIPMRFFLQTFGYSVDYNSKTQQITVTPLPVNPLTLTTKTINETNSKQEFVIQYPQLTGLADKEVQTKINSFLQSEVNKMAAAARKELKEAEPGSPNAKNGFTANYVVKSNMNGKLSLYLESYLYTGGAHGMPARQPYTFDLSTGNTLTLKQAIGGNANYKQIINKVVKEKFSHADYLLAPFESISDDQPYFLQNNAVVVYFEPYQYTPYAAGFPEFPIPLSLFH
ncbi:PdaC/SigV domain-containing protein [Gorillibacterium sp. sgz500922]|uniref:PdaC/SigV domain-containing protein n=1 Tax=Gorillibacterium sp. sgz500922 TaxID=3446694 RepID=UPI003F66F234